MAIRQTFRYAPGEWTGMQGVGALAVQPRYGYAPGAIPGMQGYGLMVSTNGGAPHEASTTEKVVVGAVVVGIVGLLVYVLVKGTDAAVEHQRSIDRMAERDPGKALGYQAGEVGLAILSRAAMRRNGRRRARGRRR